MNTVFKLGSHTEKSHFTYVQIFQDLGTKTQNAKTVLAPRISNKGSGYGSDGKPTARVQQ